MQCWYMPIYACNCAAVITYSRIRNCLLSCVMASKLTCRILSGNNRIYPMIVLGRSLAPLRKYCWNNNEFVYMHIYAREFVFQVQTRSADEPMTTFVLCNECGNRWKVCYFFSNANYSSSFLTCLFQNCKVVIIRPWKIISSYSFVF